MIVRWTKSARDDLRRLHEFLVPHDPERAVAVAILLASAPNALLEFPRRGSLLAEFAPRDVREFRVDRYLLRYELAGEMIFVLRFFHAREDRSSA